MGTRTRAVLVGLGLSLVSAWARSESAVEAPGYRAHQEASDRAWWESGQVSPVTPDESTPDCWGGQTVEGESLVCEKWHYSTCAVDSGRAARVTAVCDDFGADGPAATRFVVVGPYLVSAY